MPCITHTHTHKFCITHHTSHITHHTSHSTHHTSHITNHTARITYAMPRAKPVARRPRVACLKHFLRDPIRHTRAPHKAPRSNNHACNPKQEWQKHRPARFGTASTCPADPARAFTLGLWLQKVGGIPEARTAVMQFPPELLATRNAFAALLPATIARLVTRPTR